MNQAVIEISEAHKNSKFIGGYFQSRPLPNFIGIKMEMIEDDVYQAWKKRHPNKPYVSSGYGGVATIM